MNVVLCPHVTVLVCLGTSQSMVVYLDIYVCVPGLVMSLPPARLDTPAFSHELRRPGWVIPQPQSLSLVRILRCPQHRGAVEGD